MQKHCAVCVWSNLYLFIFTSDVDLAAVEINIRCSETFQASLVAKLNPKSFTSRYVHKSRKLYSSIHLKFVFSINLLLRLRGTLKMNLVA